jgi:ubiquinone/menaquinone biosynthesis C-methylase UbiE
MSTSQLEPTTSNLVPGTHPPSTPEKLFETMHAYQRTEALIAAIELELFTAVGEGLETVPELAQRLKASERGVRALADYMVIIGFLTKREGRYGLTADSAVFLDKRSPAYAGAATKFMGAPAVMNGFRDLATVVRTGLPLAGNALTEAEHPSWVDFARSMAPLLHMIAQQTAKLISTAAPIKVLDVSAGHGLFGISIAQQNPNAKIVGLDWAPVLSVAQENARKAGVLDRYSLLAGDAFEVSFGTGFDVVLVPNFVHHFGRLQIQKFLTKVNEALSPGGRIVIVEFVPNEDRVSPPVAAGFVLNMLALTPAGDAYTASEYEAMLRQAGFSAVCQRPLPPTPHCAIVGIRR